ncbi:hypothetical protein [Ekhidna sp.]
MPKFILILIIAFLADAEMLKSESSVPQNLASIVYSEKVLEYESGQPVFSKDVRATLMRKSNQDGVRVMINDSLDITLESEIIELYELVKFTEGTYTIVVETGNETETFGFTIR